MNLGQKIKMTNNRKKYILFGDGQSPHTLKWAKELMNYYDVFLISSTQTSPLMEEVLGDKKCFNLGVSVKSEGNSLAYLKKIFHLKRIIKSINPDIINAHYISSHGLLIALIKLWPRLKFKFVASAWGTDVLVFPFQNKVFYQIMKFVLLKADFITSDSGYMSQVIKSIKDKEVMTFTFGLDKLPEFDFTKKDENLYFSNRMLAPNYNIDRVIKAFKKIYDVQSEAKLVISHQGSEKEKLEELVKEYHLESAISFVGYLSEDEQKDIYQRASWYFSLPSSDSTSVSLLEAMAYGCIPILSDIPANREWIQHQQNGILISNIEIKLNLLIQIWKERQDLIQHNRAIIKESAIFPNTMKEYVKQMNKITL